MQKTCNECEIEKPLEEFFKDRASKDGHYTICKACKKALTLKWRHENKDKYNQSMRKYRAEHKLYFRDKNLKRSYGITEDQYQQMLLKQDYQCWICHKIPDKRLKRPLAVDHCHKTKKVRALLCYGCNRALHTLEKDGLLQRAFAYLEAFK